MDKQLRQIVYSSRAVPEGRAADLDAILEQSRHNNALDGVTGLLWSDGRRFLQVIEGASDSVGSTFGRILADPRHHRIELLADQAVEKREFGYWSMEVRRKGERADEFDARMQRRLADASPPVRAAFGDLLADA